MVGNVRAGIRTQGLESMLGTDKLRRTTPLACGGGYWYGGGHLLVRQWYMYLGTQHVLAHGTSDAWLATSDAWHGASAIVTGRGEPAAEALGGAAG